MQRGRCEGILGGDDRHSMAVLRTESSEHVEDLGSVVDRLPDVAQSVSQVLEAAGVRRDIQLALHQAADFGLRKDSAMELVIPELSVDSSPDGVSGGVRNSDDGTDVLGDRIVEPAEDALIKHHPLWITAVVVGWLGGEVGTKTKFPNEGIKEAMPLGVIGFGDVEFDGDMRLDINSLENGHRRRINGGRDVLNRRGVGSVSGGIRRREIEEGIRLHGHGDRRRRQEEVSSGRSRVPISNGGSPESSLAAVAKGAWLGSSHES